MNILLETTGMVARSEAQRGSKPKTARFLPQKTCEDCIAAPRSTHIPLVGGTVFSERARTWKSNGSADLRLKPGSTHELWDLGHYLTFLDGEKTKPRG